MTLNPRVKSYIRVSVPDDLYLRQTRTTDVLSGKHCKFASRAPDPSIRASTSTHNSRDTQHTQTGDQLFGFHLLKNTLPVSEVVQDEDTSQVGETGSSKKAKGKRKAVN
jgi:hypothetical protein